MKNGLTNIQEQSFVKLLFGKTALPIFTIIGIGILYVVLMSVIDHRSFPFPFIILVLAMVKTIMLVAVTLKQLSKMIKICHSLERLLAVFGLLIGISIFSFATDYTCLYQFEHSTFEGVSTYADSYIYNLYQFFYFSVITFSTVGYGDIAPVSEIAKFVVMLEIFLSFFIVVFALANIKKIHINE
ncbi:MAG: ion channel [Saprospiraceae bacterium]|jgi:hypothetical protein|nr:ion channel [Saprospiraceae bacterium]